MWMMVAKNFWGWPKFKWNASTVADLVRAGKLRINLKQRKKKAFRCWVVLLRDVDFIGKSKGIVCMCINIYMGLLGICNVETCSSMLDQPNDVKNHHYPNIRQARGCQTFERTVRWTKPGIAVYREGNMATSVARWCLIYEPGVITRLSCIYFMDSVGICISNNQKPFTSCFWQCYIKGW